MCRKRRSPDTDDEDELQTTWSNGLHLMHSFRWATCHPPSRLWKGPSWRLAIRVLSQLFVIRQGGRPDQSTVPQAVVDHVPESPFELDHVLLKKNLFRSSRRGAVAVPSGITTEHLKVLLNERRALHSFFLMAELLSQGQVPTDVVVFIRLGRLTALS